VPDDLGARTLQNADNGPSRLPVAFFLPEGGETRTTTLSPSMGILPGCCGNEDVRHLLSSREGRSRSQPGWPGRMPVSRSIFSGRPNRLPRVLMNGALGHELAQILLQQPAVVGRELELAHDLAHEERPSRTGLEEGQKFFLVRVMLVIYRRGRGKPKDSFSGGWIFSG